MKDPTTDRFRRQHGVISRSDAIADGLSQRQIQQRVATGLWVAVHPGVYRHAAHPVTPDQQIKAAVLAAGPGAVASHQAAAYLWNLLEWREVGERPAVTVLRPGGSRGHGFDVHRVSDLDWSRVRCGMRSSAPTRCGHSPAWARRATAPWLIGPWTGPWPGGW